MQEGVLMLELLKNGEIPESARFTFETRLPYDNGRSGRRFIIGTGEPVLTASKQIIGWLMLFRDVTEERELTEQCSDLTRMIVHALRNPVSTSISNMHHVDTLLPTGAGMEAAREAVADARQSGYDMLAMVDSLMDINRMEAVNFQALVERAVRRMKVVADQRQIVLSQHVELELRWFGQMKI